jgi:hypothetical protein
MWLLVSCSHCKHALLMVQRITRAELDRLRLHLRECRADHPVELTRIEDAPRHFRTVAIELTDGNERRPRPPAPARSHRDASRRVA